MFVTFEGVDWSGKSTQAELLADWLREQGRAVLATREGGAKIGDNHTTRRGTVQSSGWFCSGREAYERAEYSKAPT